MERIYLSLLSTVSTVVLVGARIGHGSEVRFFV